MGIISIGVDIGQKRDPTAIAVIEKEERLSGRTKTVTRTIYNRVDYAVLGAGSSFVTNLLNPHDEGQEVTGQEPIMETHYITRHLERLPLGTPYPQVSKRLVEVVERVTEKAGQEPDIFLDATGVGLPVVDLIRAGGIKGRLHPVYFVHGDRLARNEGQLTLGKAYLVSRLQTLLQGVRIHLPRTPEAEALAKELLDYEIHVDEHANDTYGAFKVGTHDDLVTALGLAVFYEPARWQVVA